MRLASGAWTTLLLAAALAASAEPTLRGRVTSWDGKPGAGVRIDVVDVAPDFTISPLPGAKFLDRALASTTTGGDGTFAIDGAGVPAGLHSLALVPVGGAPLLLDGERIAFGPPALPQDLALTLPPLVACEGVVLDERGALAAGVRIGAAVDGMLADTMMTIVTDASGAFRIEGLPAPGTIMLMARRGDDIAFGAVHLPITGSTRQALHLERGIETRGALLPGVPILATAIPVPLDAVTDLVGTDGLLPMIASGMFVSPILIAKTVTDASGAYVLRAPALSPIIPWTPTLRAAPLGEGPLTRVRPLVGRAMSGGRPVVGARIRLGTSEIATSSEADGTFLVPPADRALWTGVAPWGELAIANSTDVAPVLRFAGSRRLVGRVVEPPRDGEPEPHPVPGATVRIALHGQRPVATATDGEGGFALPVPGAVMSISTCALGQCAIVMDPGDDPARVVTLALEKPRILAGSVTSNGSRLAGALVLATPHDMAGPAAIGLTDAAGRFAIQGLPRGGWRCLFFEDRHAPTEASRVATPGDRVAGDPVIMNREGRLRVRCLDAEGRPVPNARVGADQRSSRAPFLDPEPDGPALLPTAGSGADGIAVLHRLIAGECATIHARRPGMAPAREDCVTPTPGGSTVDVVLAAAASITGVVRDLAGAVVSGAWITASPDATTASADRPQWLARPLARATTDEAGTWTLRDLAAGRLEVVAEAPGFLRTEPIAVDLVTGQRIDGVEIFLDRGASLGGDLLTSKGEPVEGAGVRASIPYGRPGAGDATPREAITDAQGRFRLEALPRQELQVDASFRNERIEPRMIVPAGEPIHLVLRPAGRIEGKVVGAERVLDGVSVTCRGAPAGEGSTVVDADGNFAMGGLPAATYTCAAICDEADGKVEGLAVREGEITTTTLTLGPRRMLDVVVLDAASGAAIAGASVRGGAAAHGPGIESTGDDGHARIPLGSFDTIAEVRAWASGYTYGRRLIPSPPPASLELRLDRACKLRGRVVDPEGLPAVGARVGFGSWLGQEVDGAGGFELETTGRTGRGVVKATREREGLLERGSLDVDVPVEGLDGLVVQLERVALGAVLVTVLDGGAPAVRANVQLVHESDSGRKDVRGARDSGMRTVS